MLPSLDEIDPDAASFPTFVESWEKWRGAVRESDDLAVVFDALPQSLQSLGPDLLYWFWRNRRPDPHELRGVLLKVWRYTDFPRFGCSPRIWRMMFRTVGFLSDDVPPPLRPRVLYRASSPKGRRGMSWTTDRATAEKFAAHWFKLGQTSKVGNVYRTVARPADVLAIIHGERRTIQLADGTERELRVQSEYEFIVDARSLPITLVETVTKRRERMGGNSLAKIGCERAMGSPRSPRMMNWSFTLKTHSCPSSVRTETPRLDIEHHTPGLQLIKSLQTQIQCAATL